MENCLIIMISSVKSGSFSGKNTVANNMVDYLLENYKDKFSISLEELSEPIKYFCYDLLRLEKKDVLYNKNKKTGIEIKNFAEDSTIRQIMQYYGTEICRNIFGYEIFIKRIEDIIKKKNKNNNKKCIFFIPDLRFDNEYEYLKNNGYDPILIDINRTSQENKDTHASQKGINNIQNLYNYTIDNDSDLDKLKIKSLEIIKDILKKRGF